MESSGVLFCFFFQAEDGIRDVAVTGSDVCSSDLNRAQWAVRSGMPRALGYFLPESSVIVPIDECPVLSPRLAHTFAQLQEMARAGTLPEGMQEIEAFADSTDDKIALNVAFERFSKP